MATGLTRSKPNVLSWLIGGTMCALFIGLTGFYGLFHLIVGIPLADLWKPYGIVSLLTLVMFTGMFWATEAYARLNDGRKRMIFVLGIYCWSVTMVGAHYGAEFGFLPTADVLPFSTFMTLGLVVSFVAVYYVRKTIDAPKPDA